MAVNGEEWGDFIKNKWRVKDNAAERVTVS